MNSQQTPRFLLFVGATLLLGCADGGQGGSTGSGEVDALSVVDDGGADTATDGSTATDTSENVDSSAVDDGAIANNGDTAVLPPDGAASPDGGAGDAGPVDAGTVGCPTKCSDTEVCKLGKCVPVPQTCGGPCGPGSYCDKKSEGGTGACLLTKCELPKKWAAATHKLSAFQVAQSAQGCDLTGNGKPNNVLGNILKLYPAINEELTKSINDGDFNLLLEAPGFNTKGTEFVIYGLLADVDPSNSSCSMTSPWATCKFTVDDDNYLGGPAATTCKPRVVFEPATIKTGELAAGDPAAGQKVVITLPTTPALNVTLSQVSLHGYPKLNGEIWKETKNGKLCGIITQKDFNTAIDSVPPDAWKTISLTKEQVKLIINATLKPDIDTNEDGFADAISVAMVLETVPATITKMTF